MECVSFLGFHDGIELMIDWQRVWIGIILISDTSLIESTTWVPLCSDGEELQLMSSWQTDHSRNKA